MKLHQHGNEIIVTELDIEKYKLGYERYEKLRKLDPGQYLSLWERALNGEKFDEMVDKL